MAEVLGVSKQTIHRILAKLVENEFVEKIGRSPKVFYRLKEKSLEKIGGDRGLTENEKVFLQEHFNLFTETRNELNGIKAFENCCFKYLEIHVLLQIHMLPHYHTPPRASISQ